jgi:ATP-dependent DNA helicase RecG
LNTRGGRVLVGVSESGRILGQDIRDTTLKEIATQIARLEPATNILMKRVPIEGTREVIVFETDDRSQAPFMYKGRAYRRVSSTTSTMPQAEYERLLLQRNHPHRRWENQVAERYRLRNLNMKEVRQAVSDAVASGRLASAIVDPVEALDKLKLIDKGRLLQAAVVAFAKEVLPDYPQCALRMARFRGITKTEFVDQQQLTGNAFALLREADVFLRRHLPVAGRFEPGVLQRRDDPLFPPLAMREALVNAFCHRDYSIAGGAVAVAIFDDRLEVSSTGLLPGGLTVEDLRRTHQSQPRNPLLANVFYLRGLIERWGRGTQKIIELCVNAGHPEPEFIEQAGEVIVRFLVSGYVPPHRISHDLSDRQRRILHALRGGERFRASQILISLTPMPSATVLRDELNLLRSFDLIEGSGRGAGARWWLKRS